MKFRPRAPRPLGAFLILVGVVAASVIFAMAMSALAGCTPKDPVPVVLQTDAGYDTSLPCPSDATCAAACCHERQLKCAIGFPTKRGNTCETICSQHDALARESGSQQIAFPKTCMVHAQTCEECQ